MTQKAAESADITVELSRFRSDPERYIREANSQRRVLVLHDRTKRVSAVFGGSLDVPPTIQETK